MSHRFELYLPRDSWLHQMDPRAKLYFILAAGLMALLFKQIIVLTALLLLAHLALLSARIPLERIRWLWARLLPLLVMILILQPIFSPGSEPAILQLGPIRLTVEGILEGTSFSLRAATLAFIAAVMLLTTEPTQLIQGLVRLGLPYPWGLTVGLAIRYLPTMFNLFATVREAQQARGWHADQGSFLDRIRSYMPVLVATIIGALRLSDKLGLALAARGLGYPVQRTVLHEIHFTLLDGLVVALTTVIFATMLALRFGLGFGAGSW